MNKKLKIHDGDTPGKTFEVKIEYPKPKVVTMIEETKYIMCDCGAEVLVITKDESYGVDFAIFKYNPGRSLRERLRLIWRIIRHGEPYTDQMCLGMDKVRDLKNYLDKCLKQ